MKREKYWIKVMLLPFENMLLQNSFLKHFCLKILKHFPLLKMRLKRAYYSLQIPLNQNKLENIDFNQLTPRAKKIYIMLTSK
jgi:hypothetical protein